MSSWFLGINPRGVVPVLVHDGIVHVESNDILEYLDANVPSTAQPFFPRNDEERQVTRESLELENSLHMDLRTITMGFLVPATLARKSEKTLTTYEQEGASSPERDKEVAWWRAFREVGVTDAAARASAAAFGRAFDEMDARLARQPWLLGERISVLEIAWFISVHRLVLAAYPLERHPHLKHHYERLRERPAFAAEISERGPAGWLRRGYGAYRRTRGTTLGNLLAGQ